MHRLVSLICYVICFIFHALETMHNLKFGVGGILCTWLFAMHVN